MQKRLGANLKLPSNAACFVVLALLTLTITILYIASERNFHWWIDWYSATMQVVTALRESPSEAMQLVQDSLVRERNRLFTLPLVPFILIFGESRLVYHISLALVYLLPLALAMGAIATELIPTPHSYSGYFITSKQLLPVYQRLIFWSTAFLTLLIPVNWSSTFIGIPDTGGTLLLGLAAFLYLQELRLKQWWRVPLIGVLIGLSVLLRRHFAYGSIAFLGAITLQAFVVLVIQIRQKRRFPWQSLLATTIRLILIAAIAFATLITIAPDFTYKALTMNYRTLYQSWSFPVGDMVNLYASFYGWGTWLLVVIGFSASILTRTVPLPTITLIGLWGIFSLIVWIGILRYANVFYSIQVTPLVIIGLATFLWTTWSRLVGRVRTVMLSVAGCYLIGNLVLGLTPIATITQAFHPLFAISLPPLVRTDYDEVVRLVNALRQLAPHNEPIYVVGYQRLQLSPSVISAAERVVYGREGRILNILPAPQVDSRDQYPLETLLQAQYVVVPNPLAEYPNDLTKVPIVGEWLPNKEIGVVRVVFEAFTQNWEIVGDFQRLPVQFKLENGSVVSLYQRIRPTSVSTAVRTLSTIQQYIGERPGGQRNWMALNQPLEQSFANRNLNNTYRLVAYKEERDGITQSIPNPSSLLPATTPVQATTELPNLIQDTSSTSELGQSFLYLGSLPNDAEVIGKVTFLDNPCVRLSLRLAMFNQDGKIVGSTESDYSPDNSSSFRLSIHGKDPVYLLLNVVGYDNQNTLNSCTLVINSLKVSPPQSL